MQRWVRFHREARLSTPCRLPCQQQRGTSFRCTVWLARNQRLQPKESFFLHRLVLLSGLVSPIRRMSHLRYQRGRKYLEAFASCTITAVLVTDSGKLQLLTSSDHHDSTCTGEICHGAGVHNNSKQY